MASGLLDKANIILTPTGYKAGTMYNVAPIEQPYEDFVFARASVASRVNSSGLVEMVGRTLGSNLIQNGDFSEIGPDLVQNGTFDLGSELIDNSDWSVNSPVTNDNGLLTFSGVSGTYASQDILTSGISYKVTFDVLSSSGNLTIFAGAANNVYEASPTPNSTLTIYVTSGGVNNRIYFGNFFTGQIQNVSVKEVPDWTLGTYTSIENNKAVITNSTGEISLRQSLGVAQKTIKVTYTISDYVSGVLRMQYGAINGTNRSANGTYTDYIKGANASQDLLIYSLTSDTSLSITNVSVQELDPNDYWTLQNGWSLGDDEAVFSGTVSAYRKLYQTNFITIGKTYQLSFEITSITAGSIANLEPGSPSFDTVGVKTQTFVATFDDLYLEPTTNANLTITNISVQEVIDTNNIPRINYDSNGENGHWLLEPTSTNLFIYSEDFSQWGESDATTTSNSATSPSGLLNADKVIASNSNSTHAIFIIPSVSASTTYTFSLYAKADEYERIYIRQGTGGNPCAAVYELSGSGSVLETYSSPVDTSINNVGNGWYRITLTNTTSPTAPNFAPNVIGIPNSGYSASDAGVSFQGDGTSGIYIWGAQLEELPYATSYIPTLTGSTETRATETANGAGSAELINSTEGVLYAEIAALANDGTFRMISLSDGTNDNRVRINYTSVSNQIQARVVVGGVTQAEINQYGFSDISDFTKIAFAYKENEVKLYINGSLIGTDTSASMPPANTFNRLNFNGAATSPFYGKCKELVVFGEALSDDELEKLTSWSSFNAMATDLGYTIE